MVSCQSYSFASALLTVLLLLTACLYVIPFTSTSSPLLTNFRACSSHFVLSAKAVPSFEHLSDYPQAPSSVLQHRASAPAADFSNVMAIIYDRRVSSIIGGLSSASSISTWLASLGENGKWPDSEVDYTTGCNARRANWPAQTHWQRILVMSGAWHGGARNAAQWVNNTRLRNAISLAMAYWFDRDIGADIACMDMGGTSACPCSNPRNTLWNTNWFSNIILIPELVGESCMLLNASLTPNEAAYCGEITTRSYRTLGTNINGVGVLTGANTLDVARISVDGALLTNNATMLGDAYRRVHDELTIKNGVKADGIRADGSFGQHSGVLYNGNYGKDYSNAALELEIATAGTQYEAGTASRNALETLFQGHKWMIFYNTLTQVLHFDFSVIGRMISFPVIDKQASGSIKMNLTTVLQLGNLWSSAPLIDFATQLMSNSATANSANLQGNKLFYTNDYMVHRAPNFVSTLKMYSTRTSNTECINTQNPKGFHLSEGTLYTYLKGDEYEDISASWDWDLIPGITVDYNNTPLNCSGTSFSGVETFVGGLSDGHSGIAVMRYTNPSTGSLRWQKTWFFLESGEARVMVNILSSMSDAPLYSVLDQKRQSGPTVVNGVSTSNSSFAGAATIWHANVGYAFPANNSFTLSIRRGPRTGSWAAIGTSAQPPSTVDLWAAWIEHRDTTAPIEYSVWPGLGQADFQRQVSQTQVQTVENNRDVSAIYDRQQNRVMLVFFGDRGGSLIAPTPPALAPLTISSTAGLVLMISLDNGTLIASDPSQLLRDAPITLSFGPGKLPGFWTGSRSKTVRVVFPQNGLAGSSVSVQL